MCTMINTKETTEGRRIETVDAIAGTTTRYYYDDQRVAVQTRVSGGVESDFRYYVFGNYIDEVLVMHVIPAQAPNQDLYYGHDHLYSPVALFTMSGAVAERYEYDAYGSIQILNSAFSILNSSQYANPYAFTGRELDILDAGSLRLMYYRARSYAPDTGRFMQRDPLLYIDGMNIYEYVRGNPANHSDPFGLFIAPGTKEVCGMLKAGFTVEELIAMGLITAGTVIVCDDPPSVPPIALPKIELPTIPRRNPQNLPVPKEQCQDKRRCPKHVEAMINGLIHATCKTKGLTCKGTDTQDLRAIKTAAASACLSARLAMKFWCYPYSVGKGDHSIAIQQAANRLKDCQTKPTIN